MSYYWFNRKDLLEKTKETYHKEGGKEKASEYYQKNKKAIKEKARNKYKNLTEEEKEKKNTISKK